MLEILKKDFYFKDDRGSLTQLFHNEHIQVNVLLTKNGVTRGDHYHKKATEYFYVISGMVEVICIDGSSEQKYVFKDGDFFVIKPMTMHKMIFREDTTMVAFYDRPIENEDGYKDIYKEW